MDEMVKNTEGQVRVSGGYDYCMSSVKCQNTGGKVRVSGGYDYCKCQNTGGQVRVSGGYDYFMSSVRTLEER